MTLLVLLFCYRVYGLLWLQEKHVEVTYQEDLFGIRVKLSHFNLASSVRHGAFSIPLDFAIFDHMLVVIFVWYWVLALIILASECEFAKNCLLYFGKLFGVFLRATLFEAREFVFGELFTIDTSFAEESFAFHAFDWFPYNAIAKHADKALNGLVVEPTTVKILCDVKDNFIFSWDWLWSWGRLNLLNLSWICSDFVHFLICLKYIFIILIDFQSPFYNIIEPFIYEYHL